MDDINKKNVTGMVVVFIAALVIGFLIVINIKIKKAPMAKQLNAKEYKDAIEERNKLFKELEILRDENYESVEKINSYDVDDEKHEKIVGDMASLLNDYGMLTGLTPVKGPGVVIKIEDGPINIKEETARDTSSKIFHDKDAFMVLNEIRNAGAEAIAIKNHRVIPSTSINCNGPFLGFENDTIESAPFYFYIIGDPEQLEVKLTKDGSYINELILRKLRVEIEVKEEIIIPSSSQPFDTIFMRESEIKQN